MRCLDMLLEHGADPTIRDSHGKTAAELAIDYDQDSAAALLAQRIEEGKSKQSEAVQEQIVQIT